MKLVFIDQFGCYAAMLAAAYVTGKIGGQPSKQDILRLPAFADQQNLRPGDLRDCGTDPGGNRIYTLGVGHEAKIMMVSACDLLHLLGAKQDILMIDVSSFNSFSQKACWYLRLIPFLQQISRQQAAVILERQLPQLFAFVDAKLTAAGLEYS